jgi:hypothetical protein
MATAIAKTATRPNANTNPNQSQSQAGSTSNRPPTVRQQIRRWLEDQVIGRDIIDQPQIASEAMAHFAQDPEFCAAVFNEALRGLVYHMLSQLMTGWRDSNPYIPYRDGYATRAAFKANADAAPVMSKWQRWFENLRAGESKVITIMTREDCLLAASIRRERASQHLKIARWLERLAEGLEPGQMVSERYDDTEITRIAAETGVVEMPLPEETTQPDAAA